MNFNEKAKNWDSIDMTERAKLISNAMMDNVVFMKDKRALEFGCGTGLISLNLHHMLKEIDAMDSSSEMISVLRRKLTDMKVENINAFIYDIMENPHLKEKYQYVFSSMVLHHIKDTEKLTGIIHELLDRQGKVIIVDLDSEDGSFHKSDDFEGHHGFDQHQLSQLLERNGFINVKSYTFHEFTRHIDGQDKTFSLFILIGEKNSD